MTTAKRGQNDVYCRVDRGHDSGSSSYYGSAYSALESKKGLRK